MRKCWDNWKRYASLWQLLPEESNNCCFEKDLQKLQCELLLTPVFWFEVELPPYWISHEKEASDALEIEIIFVLWSPFYIRPCHGTTLFNPEAKSSRTLEPCFAICDFFVEILGNAGRRICNFKKVPFRSLISLSFWEASNSFLQLPLFSPFFDEKGWIEKMEFPFFGTGNKLLFSISILDFSRERIFFRNFLPLPPTEEWEAKKGDS